MFIRILPTTLLQIFCEILLYFQVIDKSMKIADDTFLGNSECEWVKTNVDNCIPCYYCAYKIMRSVDDYCALITYGV